MLSGDQLRSHVGTAGLPERPDAPAGAEREAGGKVAEPFGRGRATGRGAKSSGVPPGVPDPLPFAKGSGTTVIVLVESIAAVPLLVA